MPVDISKGFPDAPDLTDQAPSLALSILPQCLVPAPDVVAACTDAVFRSIRGKRGDGIAAGLHDGQRVLFDDNTTPRWAILWSHKFQKTYCPKGWRFCHVWPTGKDPEAYTHLANLVIMPAAFASLSDEGGPLVSYLRYHAQETYSWRPDKTQAIAEPRGYCLVKWTYLAAHPTPKTLVANKLAKLNNAWSRGLNNI